MTRTLTSPMQAEIIKSAVKRCLLIQIYFDSGTQFYTDGHRDIDWSGDTYLSGNLLEVDGIGEALDLTTENVTITLSGANQANLSIMLTEDYIDRKVVVYESMLDTNDAIISDPFIKYIGYINYPSFDENPLTGDASLVWNVSSQLVKFDRVSGRVTTDDSQQLLFPGDRFFEYAGQVEPTNTRWGNPHELIIGLGSTPYNPSPVIDRLNRQTNSDFTTAAAIPVLYGESQIGGKCILQVESGILNQYLHLIYVWCEGEIEAIDSIYLNDILSTDSSISSFVRINNHEGTDTQAADSDLISDLASFGAYWTSAHQGKGLAYSYIRLIYDKDKMSSIPQVKATIRGKKVYDPRTTLTVYNPNLALCERDYIISDRYGLGLSEANDINETSYSDSADYCDTLRELYAGAGEYYALFTLNGLIDTSRKVRENIDEILRHGRGLHIFPDGKFNILIEKAETPAFEFNKDNIIGDWKIVGANKRNRYNRVTANYSDSSSNYKANTAYYDSTTFRSQDGGLLLSYNLDLPLCDNAYQARDLCELECRISRLNWRVSFTATIEAMECTNGQVVYLTHDTPGWSSKLFRITSMAPKKDGNVDIELIEYDANIYDLTANVERVAPSDTGLIISNNVGIPSGLILASGTSHLIQNPGGLISRIYAEWTAPNDAFVIGYDIQYKKSSDSSWLPITTPVGRDSLSAYISPAKDGVNYDVRVRAVNGLGYHSDWLTIYNYTVIGQNEAPPDVNTFTVLRQTDGTRQFDWTYDSPPIDFQSGGFQIRYKLGTGGTWATMTALHTGLLQAGPWETNKLAAGTYTFGIKAVDSSGNYCANAVIIEATLDDPRLADSVTAFDSSQNGWLGTKTSCHVAPDGTLEADDSTTWNDLPATWAGWTRWNYNPATSFTYIEEIDIGTIITCAPLATATSASDVTLELSYSSDGSSYSSYAAIGETITARYIRIRATVAQRGSEVPFLYSLFINITAKTVDEDINDLDISTLTGSYRIATGDIRLPITKTYVVIKQVAPIIQNITAGDKWDISLEDKDTSVGPRLKFYKNGTLADPPLIDAYVKGV